MQKTSIEHTTDIFERMYDNLPPLIPEKTRNDMYIALEQIKGNRELPEEELEHTMIHFAKLVWPEMQAFQEFYNSYESQMAETAFIQKLPPMLRKRYQEYKDAGHSYGELNRGLNLHFFADHERILLHQFVVDVTCDVRAFAFQALTHSDRVRYEERIEEFREILAHIETQLDDLRELANNEQEHPHLASEIREHVRGFEHGFALLGPSVDYQAVCQSHEHFQGRKNYLKMRV